MKQRNAGRTMVKMDLEAAKDRAMFNYLGSRYSAIEVDSDILHPYETLLNVLSEHVRKEGWCKAEDLTSLDRSCKCFQPLHRTSL